MAEEITLQSLARRIERLEEMLRVKRGLEPTKDWRKVVGICGDSEFAKLIDAEGRAIREADRQEPLP